MNEIKKIWLKNVKNGLMHQINADEIGIYQKDKTEVVVATDAEVEAYKNGTHWDNFKTPKTETPKVTTPKTETK